MIIKKIISVLTIIAAAAVMNPINAFCISSKDTEIYVESTENAYTQAEDDIIPIVSDNLRKSLRRTSYLVPTDGGYMRVFYNSTNMMINVEYYDYKFNIMSRKIVEMELSLWGGFYKGSDAYYLIEGENNTNEDTGAEVIRVIKYDTDWNRISAAKITGNSEFANEVRFPFDYGCVEAAEYNGELYIVTGHEGYVDPKYNQGHQGFLMIKVDLSSMNGEIVDADLWHSFAQYIDNKGSDFYVLELSEGSRYTKLSKYDFANGSKSSIPVFNYGGTHTSAWSIPCYASVDGMALSSENVLCLGTSIDQSEYDNYSYDTTAYNIYLTVTSMSDFSKDSTELIWLTDNKDNGIRFSGTDITKISDDRFMISWEESQTDDNIASDETDILSDSTLHYIFIDGSGKKVSEEFTAKASFSDCKPVLNGSEIVYYASNSSMIDFYTIDAYTGEFSKKVYRIVGENAQWSLNDGILTIYGKGDMFDNLQINPWSSISSKVKKIVIEGGITSVPDNAFNYFNELTEVVVGSGVKKIGNEAFYRCQNLEKVYIPSSVEEIGEDIVWTGYFWTHDNSHVYYADIYAPLGSYAEKYAKENDITFVEYNSEDIKGDVNGDNEFDINDLVLLRKWLLAIPDITLSDWEAGDMNGDKKLNVFDFCVMLSSLTEQYHPIR